MKKLKLIDTTIDMVGGREAELLQREYANERKQGGLTTIAYQMGWQYRTISRIKYSALLMYADIRTKMQEGESCPKMS